MFDAWRLLSLLHWMCKMCDSTTFTEIMVGSRQDEPIPQKPQWQKPVRQLVLQDHVWSWRLDCDRTASFPGVYSMVRGFAATWSLCTDNFQCWLKRIPRWIREVQDLLWASWVPLLVESTLGTWRSFWQRVDKSLLHWCGDCKAAARHILQLTFQNPGRPAAKLSKARFSQDMLAPCPWFPCMVSIIYI